MKNYQIKLNQKQLELIQESLDLYSRLKCGQIEELSNKFSSPFYDRINNENTDIINDCVNELKKNLFPDLSAGSFYGIFSNKAPESAKISYDMIQVIRHGIAWSVNPKGGMTVNFDSPLKCSKENLITIKEVK